MAFTDTQKAAIRRYLGYAAPAVMRAYDLEGALELIDAESELIAEDILDQLAALDTALTTAITASRAGLKRAEEVEWYEGGARGELLAERRRLTNELASLLGVENKAGSPTAGPLCRG